MTLVTEPLNDRRRVSMPSPAEFPCCGRGASLGDDRLSEIAEQLANGADEVVLDRKCQGVECKDPETGKRGIRYRLHVTYSPANGVCGANWALLRATWERLGTNAPSLPLETPEPVLFATRRDWVQEITPSVIRAWATEQGLPVGARGRIHPDIATAYEQAHA